MGRKGLTGPICSSFFLNKPSIEETFWHRVSKKVESSSTNVHQTVSHRKLGRVS